MRTFAEYSTTLEEGFHSPEINQAYTYISSTMMKYAQAVAQGTLHADNAVPYMQKQLAYVKMLLEEVEAQLNIQP